VHSTGEQQEKTIGGIAFAEDYIARRINLFRQVLSDQAELSQVDAMEEFHLLEHGKHCVVSVHGLSSPQGRTYYRATWW
jgi:hypothetical protein